MAAPVTDAPQALLRTEDELPFVPISEDATLQLLQVDLNQGIWVVRNKFQPGAQIQTHKHTGPVYAFTHAGAWHYLEYPDDVNRPGSYLFEPAGSVHTLKVLEDNDGITDVSFVIHGANLNLDDAGRVEMVVDAHLVYQLYVGACRSMGVENPPVIVVE